MPGIVPVFSQDTTRHYKRPPTVMNGGIDDGGRSIACACENTDSRQITNQNSRNIHMKNAALNNNNSSTTTDGRRSGGGGGGGGGANSEAARVISIVHLVRMCVTKITETL